MPGILLCMNQQIFSETTTAPLTAGVQIRRVEAIVNVAGGSVESGAAEELEALVAEFGIAVHVASVEPKEIETAVRHAVSADPDLVVVLAGDGTARLAAQLCGAHGPLIASLPGGTMNVLPNALYNGLSWREALKASLSDGRIRPVAGGVVDGQAAFYVAAVLGAPALWAPAREAVRNMELKAAWDKARHALSHAFSRKLHFSLDDGPELKAEALAVMCPMVSSACEDETAFEAAALDPQGAADAFRLGVNMLRGEWRSDPSVLAERCLHAHAWARRPVPCILDGEMHMLGHTVEIEFKPTAFRALVPASETNPNHGPGTSANGPESASTR